ncbi:MAG: 3-isopropylmalate dehydratase small subunit [Synergistaceae bacterium]|jgi:3-isopropylmalate/(R)-2-methylmalate dehydratase small subunit|nr:3-isopropylmalate dehydratase small subunit [Synergistaceae bacterium]
MIIKGKVWKFGDNINTDLILPTQAVAMSPKERAQYVFSANRPGWAQQVSSGDIVIAGTNFGTGSSRPAALTMKDLGLGCLLAENINGLFFRSCVNESFPALEVKGVCNCFEEGDIAEVDFTSGKIVNMRTSQEIQGDAWPDQLLAIYNAGGIIPLLKSQDLLEEQSC